MRASPFPLPPQLLITSDCFVKLSTNLFKHVCTCKYIKIPIWLEHKEALLGILYQYVIGIYNVGGSLSPTSTLHYL